MTRNKTVYQATVSPTIIFAVFYVCWIEDAVCSEIQDENTIEHCRLPQCDTEHKHILSKYGGSKNFKYI